MNAREVIIRSLENQIEREQMFSLRWLVLRKPLGKDKGTEQDEYEDESFHLIAIYNNILIGCARLRMISAKIGSINYVAVLPEFQNQGIGSKIVIKLIEQAKNENLEELKLKSRFYCVDFYKKLGFKESGEPFDFLGICHIPMILKL